MGYLTSEMKRESGTRELDNFERKIIQVLSTEARLPLTEVARRVGLSKSPCQVRLKRLEAEGYILGYRTIFSVEKLRQEHVCFVEVKLDSTKERSLAEFNQAVLSIPEIEQCHMLASSFDYLLKVRTEDIKVYRRVLAEKISTLPHVEKTSTSVSMQSVKDSAF